MKIFKKLFIIFTMSLAACKTTGPRIVSDDFSVNMKSPQITIGEVEYQFETLMGLGKIRKQDVSVIYFPVEDAVCLKYKYEFYTYYQFWGKKGRLNFLGALQKYNEDYEGRKLQNKSRDALKKYGAVKGYLVWQQLSFTTQAHSNIDINLGYAFKNNAPYFTMLQRDTQYYDETEKNQMFTANLRMYFTRAQAAELAEIFEQFIFLDGEKYNMPEINNEIPADSY